MATVRNVEKIVTILWRPEGQPKQAFADALVSEAAPRMIAAGARWLKVCVEDDAVDADPLRMNPVPPPKAAMVSYWGECHEDRGPLEDELARHAITLASFLVLESRPVVNTEHVAEPGARTPGMVQVTAIVRRPDISEDEFRRIWHEEQRPCAIETQSTFGYVRNEIVRTLAGDPPPWDAIGAESFPLEAMSDPAVFFDAVGDPDKLAANIERMVETVSRMLDLGQTDVTITSEYVFER